MQNQPLDKAKPANQYNDGDQSIDAAQQISKVPTKADRAKTKPAAPDYPTGYQGDNQPSDEDRDRKALAKKSISDSPVAGQRGIATEEDDLNYTLERGHHRPSGKVVDSDHRAVHDSKRFVKPSIEPNGYAPYGGKSEPK